MAQETGRAALFWGAGKPFEVREFPVPEPEPGAAVIKISVANICGSDMHVWRGELDYLKLGRPMPLITGHEMTGRIHKLGEGLTHDSSGAPLKVGDRVVYRYLYPCRRCRACLRRHFVACPNSRYNFSKSSLEWPHFNGAYAEYYYLRPNADVFKVPDELSDEMVAGINCALSQVIYGFQRAGLKLGDRVVIQGAGGLGVYACAVARESGADKVIVIDGIDERLALAREFGADEVIDFREYATPEARVKRVSELTEGWGGDIVAELAGHPRVVPEGLKMTGPGGVYLEIGNINVGLTFEMDPSKLIFGPNKTLLGIAYYEAETLKQAIDLMMHTRHRYPYQKVLSHTFPLERINQAFAEQDLGHITRGAIKFG